MIDPQLKAVETLIENYCAQAGLPEPGAFQWMPIPFAGEWGVSTSFFQLAAQEAAPGCRLRRCAPAGAAAGAGDRCCHRAAGRRAAGLFPRGSG